MPPQAPSRGRRGPAVPAGGALFAAADLGATSGRVVTGRVGRDTLALTEVHRFPNTPVALPEGLCWNILGLHQGVLDGLSAAARTGGGSLASVGVDSWAVDFGLLDADGALLGAPLHYRDPRHEPASRRVLADLGAEELHRVNGLQHLPFHTVFQLEAARRTARWQAARTLLLVPDLLVHWLTGSLGTEVTNASTTGLLDATTGRWSADLLARTATDPRLLPPLRDPGDPAGTLLPHVADATGLPATTPVTTVASHDTASAVVAVPATGPGTAYISCGTWSLAGLELPAPVLTPASRAADFTNERGVDGTVRFLRNIAGMWPLEECRRTWAREDGAEPALADLLHEASRAPRLAAVLDPDHPDLRGPGDMPRRLAERLRATGQPVPATRGGLVRCVLESLALGHRRVLRRAAELADREVRRVHVVGGGSRNALLCQWTADATGLPVTAGPAEATALGNVLVQARAHGLVGDLDAMRRLVAATQPLTHYTPTADRHAWHAAEARLDT